MQQHDSGDVEPTSPDDATVPQAVATPAPTTDDDATASRHRYTMTVEDVASRLHTYGLDRDARTIQRWCKSSRLNAVLDHANGDRWLIDPASLEPVIDDIQKELSRQPQPFTPMSRRHEPVVADAENVSRHSPDIERENAPGHSDFHSDNAATSDDYAATSAPVGDTVAALQKRVSELELEKVHLEADKRVREQLNDYMKEQFENMIETALDRTEEIGRLRAENATLLQALPQPEAPAPSTEHFSPPTHGPTDEISNAASTRTEAIDNANTWQGIRRV